MNKLQLNKKTVAEIIFQVILNSLVFIFFAFDRRNPGIELHKFFFYFNYAVAALVINYVLLPKYFYKNRYFTFIIYALVIVGLVIFTEEAILEKIYYPDTRGRKFLGVMFNLMGTLPTLTVLVGFKFGWDALSNKRKVEELKSSVKESELNYLKSQINPHFLFNNLNNLYAHAVEQSPKTPDIILQLSDVLRYMLYECKADYVPLDKEIKQLKSYVNLSELQIEGRAKVNFKTQNITGSIRIAPLILIVFIENAFKHSASSLSDNIVIDINIEKTEEDQLRFHCQNTYSSTSNISSLKGGIGLSNVNKRLQLLYPQAHELTISEGNGEVYTVDLTIDLN